MFGPGHNNEVSTHFMEARCLARDAVMTDLKNGNMTHKHHNHKWGRRRLRISRPVILHTDPLWYDATKPACCWYMSIIGTALQMRCPDWPFRCFLEALAACAGICWDFGYGWIVHDDCFVQKDPVVCWSNGRCFLICDRCVASRETRADLSGQIFWHACFSLQVSKPKKNNIQNIHTICFWIHSSAIVSICWEIVYPFEQQSFRKAEATGRPYGTQLCCATFPCFSEWIWYCVSNVWCQQDFVLTKSSWKKIRWFFYLVFVSTIADQAWT